MEEILEVLYKQIQPKSFKDFWKNLSIYVETYPVLRNVTLKEVEVAYLKNQGN